MDGEVFNTIKGIASWASTIALALIGWAWKLNAEEHKDLRRQIKEADEKTRAYVDSEVAKLMAELTVQRGHIAKLFDKLEAHGQRSEDRHIEVLHALRRGDK